MGKELRELVEEKIREFLTMDPTDEAFDRAAFDACQQQVIQGHLMIREGTIK